GCGPSGSGSAFAGKDRRCWDNVSQPGSAIPRGWLDEVHVPLGPRRSGTCDGGAGQAMARQKGGGGRDRDSDDRQNTGSQGVTYRRNRIRQGLVIGQSIGSNIILAI